MEPSVALRRSRGTEDMRLPGELQFLSQTSEGCILTSLQQGIATNRTPNRKRARAPGESPFPSS